MSGRKETLSTISYDDISENSSFNLGCLADFHAWQKEGKNYDIGFEEAKYFKQLSEKYDLDAVCLNGDFGSYDALDGFLDGLDGELPVYILEGDEDHKMRIDGSERKIGWRYQTKGQRQPFNTPTEYSIVGSNMVIDLFDNYEAWFQHKPRWENRDEDLLFNIDPVKRKQDYHKQDVPPELLEDPVIGVHAHTHRPQSMEVGRSGIISVGAANNYGVTPIMPESSVNILEFSETHVDNMHIDRELDQIFEIERFELEDVNKEFAAPRREEFRKKLVYSREGKDLSPLERFNTIPEEVRETAKHVLNPAD